jgi:hypothetical protein
MKQVPIVGKPLIDSIFSFERVFRSPLLYGHNVCTARFHQVTAKPLVPKRQVFFPPNETPVDDKFDILEFGVVFGISKTNNRMLERVKNRLLQDDYPKHIRGAAISNPAAHLSIDFP